MIDLNKLKAAAEAAKAYQPDAIKAHSFGCFDEEGVFYELGNVCARIYERDENSDGSFADDALLNHIIAASPDAVLELIAMAPAAAPQVVADVPGGNPGINIDQFTNCSMVGGVPHWPMKAHYQANEANSGAPAAQYEANQAAARVQAQEPVAEVSAMPGTSGFTMAVFKADDMPIGSKVYRAPVQPEAVPDGDLPTDPIGCAGYLAGMAFGNCPADEIGHCVSIITAALPAPAAQGDAKELADAEYKEGEPGWRPACCNRSGDGPCCDIGYCAADKERAEKDEANEIRLQQLVIEAQDRTEKAEA